MKNMSSIGPQLPPHLVSDDESGPNPAVVGPQIPSELLTTKGGSQKDVNKDGDDDDDDDDYTPDLPPAMKTAAPKAQTQRRVVGPSMPTYLPTYDPQTHLDEDDSDDDVGPKPLPSGMRHAQDDAVREFMEREERRRKEAEEASKPKAPKRDEWMLVPPSSSDLLGRLDPTKLKARQFAKSAAPSSASKASSLWTETPAERQQRLADEVSGKKRRAVDTAAPDPEEEAAIRRKRRRDEDIRKGVDLYTDKIRGPSLITQHTANAPPSEGKEKEGGIWDHSRDMALGGRLMDDEKRNKLVREAKGLGDRFGTGKGGGFL